MASGFALLVYSVRERRAANTPVPGNKPTVVVVKTGPYRFSRNPIDLAITVIQLGIVLWASSPWLLATLAGAIGVMSLIVIPREERYLESIFAPEYTMYKESTRRWL